MFRFTSDNSTFTLGLSELSELSELPEFSEFSEFSEFPEYVQTNQALQPSSELLELDLGKLQAIDKILAASPSIQSEEILLHALEAFDLCKLQVIADSPPLIQAIQSHEILLDALAGLELFIVQAIADSPQLIQSIQSKELSLDYLATLIHSKMGGEPLTLANRQYFLHQIIDSYYPDEEGKAKEEFQKNIFYYSKINSFSSEEIAKLNQLAQTIIDIREDKHPCIDIDLFKKFLALEDVKKIVREAVLHGASIKNMPRAFKPEVKLHGAGNKKYTKDNVKNNLMIFTEVSWGTLGDYYAAARLIHLFRLKKPDLIIHWVLRGVLELIPNELKTDETLFIDKIRNWNELLLREDVEKKLEPVAAILIFPTFHFLTKAQLSLLQNNFKKPIIACLEYSFEYEQHNPQFIELKTGLGPYEMGIFVCPQDEQHPLSKIDAMQPIIKVLFSENASQFADSRVSVTKEQIKAYEDDYTLFVCHANKDIKRVVNKAVSVEQFILLAFSLEEESKKNIDIIAPITLEDFKSKVIFDYEKYSKIVFINQVDNNIKEAIIHIRDNSALPQVRIINLFRFDNNTFIQLIAASHPLKLCTGDQSLSDVISVVHSIVLYQMMGWKQKLSKNYIDIAKLALQELNIDRDLSPAIKFLTEVNSSQLLDLKELKQYIKNPQLIEEFQIIHNYIITHKNLNHILPQAILELLAYLEIEDPLLQGEMFHQERELGFFKRLASSEGQHPDTNQDNEMPRKMRRY